MKGANIVGSVVWTDKEKNTTGMIVLSDDNYYIFPCPHCLALIKVKAGELNCRVFRHGIYRKNFKGIPAHLPKNKCEELVRRACIIGCAKPFEFFGGGKGNLADKKCIVKDCEYK